MFWFRRVVSWRSQRHFWGMRDARMIRVAARKVGCLSVSDALEDGVLVVSLQRRSSRYSASAYVLCSVLSTGPYVLSLRQFVLCRLA